MKRLLAIPALFLLSESVSMSGELSHFRIDRSLPAEKKITLGEGAIEFPEFESLPDAVRVKRGALVHTRQLRGLDTGKGDFGFGDLIGQLKGICRAHDSTLEDVAKLNVYVGDAGRNLRTAVMSGLESNWPEGKLPALTIIPTPHPGETRIAADAVLVAEDRKGKVERFERDAATMPANRDILFVSGRAASGELAEATAGTMTELFAVLEDLGSTPADVVQVKAFIKPMTGWKIVEREIEKSFGDLGAPPLVFVEWTSTSRATEIELIAAAPDQQKKTGETVSYFTPPGDKSSPVFSRVARIHSDEVIYISGLTGTDNSSPEAEVKTLFGDLERIAKTAGSDLRHFAKATYYVSDNPVSAALNKLRPDYYDPQRPPAASKVAVSHTGVDRFTLLIDMVGAPAATQSGTR